MLRYSKLPSHVLERLIWLLWGLQDCFDIVMGEHLPVALLVLAACRLILSGPASELHLRQALTVELCPRMLETNPRAFYLIGHYWYAQILPSGPCASNDGSPYLNCSISPRSQLLLWEPVLLKLEWAMLGVEVAWLKQRFPSLNVR